MDPSKARWILSKPKWSAFQNLWRTLTKGAICNFSPPEWKAQHENQNKEPLRSAPSPVSYLKQQTPAGRARKMSGDGARSMMLQQARECRANEPLTSNLVGGLRLPEHGYHAVFHKGICEKLQDHHCWPFWGLWLYGHFVACFYIQKCISLFAFEEEHLVVILHSDVNIWRSFPNCATATSLTVSSNNQERMHSDSGMSGFATSRPLLGFLGCREQRDHRVAGELQAQAANYLLSDNSH